MALKEYQRKRHFERTPEPRGATGKAKGHAAGALSFVVQKHAASRLHYDFRLEMGGVLKSWAVPKGPSLDPEDRVLAVEVEDHPIEYGGFEGIIPHGQYGGGTVMLWDRGTWELSHGNDPLEAWRAGKLTFALHGKKLQGKWLLVRMRPRRAGDKNQWLLRKLEDAHARAHARYDVREEEPRSVASKRTMEAIARAADRTWGSHRDPTSNGAAKTKSGKRAPSSRAAHRRAKGPDVPSVAGAVRAPKPETCRAELATLVERAPEGDAWIHETKFDGYRILAHADRGKVRLISRNDKDWTEKFAGVAKAVADLGLPSVVLDGEVVALDAQGISSFQALQGQLKGKGAGLSYYVFDLLYCGGWDLRGCALRDRREALQELLKGAGVLADRRSRVRFSEAIRGHGEDVYRNACRLAMEGVVSKRLDSVYRGERTREWLKSKCISRQELVIGGYTEPRKSRTALGALLLGYYKGGALEYAGKVGTGMDERMLGDLLKKLRPTEQPDAPFRNPPRGAEARGAHWVRPTLVAEVEFTQWTKDGSLRHPSFAGLREDKDPADVVREQPGATSNGTATEVRRAARQRAEGPMVKTVRSSKNRAVTSDAGEDEILGVRLTHPDKVLYAAHGITKRDLAKYYGAVGVRMLEEVGGRPLMLVRCPAGQQAKCFHQKNWDEEMPAGAHGVKIKESSSANIYLVLDSPAGLVWLVQRGVLEIHNWGARERDPERPDRMVFDLDPAPEVEWAEVRRGAELVRSLLDKLGLESFVKTTGGKGLHVVVPLTPKAGWEDVKRFAKSLADEIVRKEPDKFIATMSKAKRSGKIYVDYLRNGRGATFVAAYSTRAREGAPVSVPLGWKELAVMKSRPAFTMDEVIDRVQRAKDPWASIGSTRQSLSARK